MTLIHKLGAAVAAMLLALGWIAALKSGNLALGVGPTVLLAFIVALLILAARTSKPPASTGLRPLDWRPPKPCPTLLVGPSAWAASCWQTPSRSESHPDVHAEPVVAAVRERAPIATGLSLPEIDEQSEFQRDLALAALPDVGAFWNPAPWPVCCERLTILWLADPTRAELANLEALTGSLDQAAPDHESWPEELARIRSGLPAEDGVNVFVCSCCRRVYGVHSHT